MTSFVMPEFYSWFAITELSLSKMLETHETVEITMYGKILRF